MNTTNVLSVKGMGKLIFTAPHTIHLNRNNTIHVPELFVKKIILDMQKILGNNKIKTLTWKLKPDKNNIKYDDPNYLLKKNYKDNIWYKELKNIAVKNKKNLFFIDFHGMLDKYNYDIIIGLDAIKKNLGKTHYNKCLSCLIDIFEPLAYKYNLKIGYNIIFTGYISNKIFTLSHINTLLGHPSVQIEMSKKFREKIIKDKILLKYYSECFLNLYKCYYI